MKKNRKKELLCSYGNKKERNEKEGDMSVFIIIFISLLLVSVKKKQSG